MATIAVLTPQTARLRRENYARFRVKMLRSVLR
jgi:hypothetical protein